MVMLAAMSRCGAALGWGILGLPIFRAQRSRFFGCPLPALCLCCRFCGLYDGVFVVGVCGCGFCLGVLLCGCRRFVCGRSVLCLVCCLFSCGVFCLFMCLCVLALFPVW